MSCTEAIKTIKELERIRNPSSKRDLAYLLLQLVPIGYTITYKALAEALSTSPRAVGAYMKSNKLPIIIPCHRVVRSDGSLGGYSVGGVRVKTKLLEIEGAIKNGKLVKVIKSFKELLDLASKGDEIEV